MVDVFVAVYVAILSMFDISVVVVVVIRFLGSDGPLRRLF